MTLATGEVAGLFEKVGEYSLHGPNAMLFDADGGFYFTNHGKSHPRHRDYGGLFYVSPGTTAI